MRLLPAVENRTKQLREIPAERTAVHSAERPSHQIRIQQADQIHQRLQIKLSFVMKTEHAHQERSRNPGFIPAEILQHCFQLRFLGRSVHNGIVIPAEAIDLPELGFLICFQRIPEILESFVHISAIEQFIRSGCQIIPEEFFQLMRIRHHLFQRLPVHAVIPLLHFAGIIHQNIVPDHICRSQWSTRAIDGLEDLLCIVLIGKRKSQDIHSSQRIQYLSQRIFLGCLLDSFVDIIVIPVDRCFLLFFREISPASVDKLGIDIIFRNSRLQAQPGFFRGMAVIEIIVINHPFNLRIILLLGHPLEAEQEDEGSRQTLLAIHNLNLLIHRTEIRFGIDQNAEEVIPAAIRKQALQVIHEMGSLTERIPGIISLIYRNHELTAHHRFDKVRHRRSDWLFDHSFIPFKAK